MKTKVFTAIGLLSIFAGAMMGDSKKVMPSLVLIAIGCVVLLITIKVSQNEKVQE